MNILLKTSPPPTEYNNSFNVLLILIKLRKCCLKQNPGWNYTVKYPHKNGQKKYLENFDFLLVKFAYLSLNIY